MALKQEKPPDLIDETLADIASDTKGEAWVTGYNAAITDVLELFDNTTP